jgi:hypothetical protein
LIVESLGNDNQLGVFDPAMPPNFGSRLICHLCKAVDS